MPLTLQEDTKAARTSHGPGSGFSLCSTERMKCAVARGHLEVHHSSTDKKLVTTVNFPNSKHLHQKPTQATLCDAKCRLIANRERKSSFTELRNIPVQPTKQTFPPIKSMFKQGETSHFAKIKQRKGILNILLFQDVGEIRGKKTLVTIWRVRICK